MAIEAKFDSVIVFPQVVEGLVQQLFGSDVAVVDLRIRSGSVIISIGLGAFAVYEGISRYENFVKSVKLLASQITQVLARLFANPHDAEGPQPRVSGVWHPGQAVLEANRGRVWYRHFTLDEHPAGRNIRIDLVAGKEVEIILQNCLKLLVLILAKDYFHRLGLAILYHVNARHVPPGFVAQLSFQGYG